MSWLNSWIEAEPLYRQAELQFIRRHQLSQALYARVSEMPAHSESSTSVPAQIALLTHDLSLPEAQEPETRLRVLTILGMLEVNYDAGMARKTWADVEALAIRQHHYLLASRAMGEQGITAFLLGDIATAKKNVAKAWFVAKTADPGAHIRYASMYGAGLVEMHKYKEALGPLDEAIKVAGKTRGAAYPTIAITAKIEALSGLGENKEALALASEEMRRVHLLPFAALADNGHYILASHLVSVVPSGTVLHMLEHRAQQTEEANLPYVGVAAWTTDSPPHTLLASIHRAVSGPERSELVALPESRHEVEAIAADLPKPSTILLGASATETNFKQLPLGQFSVIHLALHGYVDPEIPDRSALVFAPQAQPTDDGLLQIREIRNLHLNASLVTLSACNTGVGPVGEEGVASIVNAFIEAGSQSVVSTLWELEDHATAHLMTTFYGHLGQLEEKAVALRQAQLEMLNSGAPPYYWAGFVLAGNPRGSLFPAPTVNLTARSSR
jgi:hypothetical protein